MTEAENQKRKISFSASFGQSDMAVYEAMEKYLQATGQSTNAYIKELIKKDLDEWEARKQ